MTMVKTIIPTPILPPKDKKRIASAKK
jgi:hypothetical protein